MKELYFRFIISLTDNPLLFYEIPELFYRKQENSQRINMKMRE